jgi:cyclase
MIRPRVIPFLLVADGGLIKTKKFTDRRYVGDATNAVRIFNEKEVDELVLLDIDATRNCAGPQYHFIEDVLSEAFMPVGYGGGVTSLDQIERLFKIGVEKVVINSALAENPRLLFDASRVFGSQSIVASLDVKRDIVGRYRAYVRGGTVRQKTDPLTLLKQWEQLGAGEIVINCIERDGTRKGYDLDFIAKASSVVHVPVVAVGGAGHVGHLSEALKAGASAVGAGSMFVFHGVHQAVLISYVDRLDYAALGSA